MNHILLDNQDEAVKQFFLTLAPNLEGAVVELNGVALACLVRVPVAPEDNGKWSQVKNERRCDLIDKELDGTLTPAEVVELETLQQAMLAYRNTVAPLPLTAVRKLYDELLAKAAGVSTTR